MSQEAPGFPPTSASASATESAGAASKWRCGYSWADVVDSESDDGYSQQVAQSVPDDAFQPEDPDVQAVALGPSYRSRKRRRTRSHAWRARQPQTA